jgi:hypothetical protein
LLATTEFASFTWSALAVFAELATSSAAESMAATKCVLVSLKRTKSTAQPMANMTARMHRAKGTSTEPRSLPAKRFQTLKPDSGCMTRPSMSAVDLRRKNAEPGWTLGYARCCVSMRMWRK